MAVGCWVGVNSTARRVRKAWVGVNGVARKVRKGWVGVNGLARLCFTSGEFTRTNIGYATIPRFGAAGGTVGTYALFAGGMIHPYGESATYYANVSAYNSSYTETTITALASASAYMASASVGNYVLFTMGIDLNPISDANPSRSTVDAYNASLTHSTPTVLSQARAYGAGASIGNYALFAGGFTRTTTGTRTHYSIVDAYNTSLTRTTPTGLSLARSFLASASNSNYAIFAGGDTGTSASSPSYTMVVDAYNSSLTRSTSSLQALSLYRGAGMPSHAIFAAEGGTGSTVAFNTSLTASYIDWVDPAGRDGMAGAGLDECVIFMGGYSGTTEYSNTDVYTDSLTHSSGPTVSAGGDIGAARVGTDDTIIAFCGKGINSNGSFYVNSTVSAFVWE